jgi:hypothetical protein
MLILGGKDFLWALECLKQDVVPSSDKDSNNQECTGQLRVQTTLLRYDVPFLVTGGKIFGNIEHVLKKLPIFMSHTPDRLST